MELKFELSKKLSIGTKDVLVYPIFIHILVYADDIAD